MVITDKLKRPLALAAAALLVVASLIPLATNQKASAYGLVTERYIKMSSSTPGDDPDNPGDDVRYEVSFEAATASAFEGIVVDFCDSPIIGDACNPPAGFDVNEATLDVNTPVGINAGYTIDAATDTNTLILTNAATPITPTVGQTISFTLGTDSSSGDGVKNPDGGTPTVAPEDNITFYARILTYDTAANAAAYSPLAAGGGTGVIDAGGVALSTANQLTITAKVQEQLTFCVYTSGSDCATGVGNSITMGNAQGVLSENQEYTNNVARFGVQSNANGGTGGNLGKSVAIRVRGGTLKSSPSCADGAGQTCSIDPIGGTPVDTVAGVERFGLCVNASADPLDAESPYGDATNSTCDGTQNGATLDANTNEYSFDDNNTTGTQSPYGQRIASFNAATERTGILQFVGDIGATTEPGIYTTTLNFIATGTY